MDGAYRRGFAPRALAPGRGERDAAAVAGGGVADRAARATARNSSASRFRNGAIAELLRQTIAMRRLGAWPRNSMRWMFPERATGGFTASVGSSVTPTFAATIWRSVSRLVARNPLFSPAPASWQTSSA